MAFRRPSVRSRSAPPEFPKAPGATPEPFLSGPLLHAAAVCFLLVPVLTVFWQVGSHPFSQVDDPAYVTGNIVVRSGLRWDSVAWAFTSFFASNWHPLTWISHMADVEGFGLSPRAHHFVNLAFHVANTLILYGVLFRMTGDRMKSFFVAALFGVHPLHVESVVWVSERKDLLSTLFGLSSVAWYAAYAERPSAGRYAMVALFMGLSLMSKPMLVTLPFVFLLLDFWPLERWRRDTRGRLLLEKAPLLLLSAGSSVMTVLAQAKGGSLASIERLTLGERFGNAAVSYAVYLGKVFWPDHLAFFYPYSVGDLSRWNVAGAVAILLSVSAASVYFGRKYRYLAFGWLFFVGTAVPVIGIVQVGMQSMADRYMYVPAVGVFVAVAWGGPDLLSRMRIRDRFSGRVAAVLAVLVLLSLSAAAWRQARYWKSDSDRNQRALAVTKGNWTAHYLLGTDLGAAGNIDEGIRHLRAAVALKPTHPDSQGNLAVFLAMKGHHREAVPHHQAAIALNPASVAQRYNYGRTLLNLGIRESAAEQFRQALAMDPGNVKAREALREISGAGR